MIIIRLARASDIEKIVSLHSRSWRENYTKSLSDKFLNSDEVIKNRTSVWQKRLGGKSIHNQYVAVAEKEGNFAGFICVYLDKHKQYGTLIDNLHVEPEMRKMGVATYLLNSAAQWINNNRPENSVYLEVYTENTRAQKFYENIAGKYTTATPFKVTAVDGGITDAYHVLWNTPKQLLEATEKKLLLNEVRSGPTNIIKNETFPSIIKSSL